MRHRHRFGRPVLREWRAWVEEVADRIASWARSVPADGDASSTHGLGTVAWSLRHCGERCTTYDCDGCGRERVLVEVPASCHVRVCPWCARVAAGKAVERVNDAAERVPGYVVARAPVELARIMAEEEAARESVSRWSRLSAAAAKRGNHALALRHTERAASAEQRRRLAARARHALRNVHGWTWKLITVSPPRDPMAMKGYTPEGLAAAVEDCFERCKRLWDAGLSVDGLASSVERIEVSATGHVHAHVLYYGPFVVNSWARKIAGCIVDVRKCSEFHDGEKGALKEALKYTLKSPSVTRGGWIAGDAWRVAHPALAAAWVVGTRRAQLVRYRGVIRDAFAAVEACEEKESEVPQGAVAHACPYCKRQLGAGVEHATADVARQLGAAWRNALRIVETHL